MVIALIVLALAMMAGGVYAMIEGYAIVVLEQGWAMLIGGSAITAGGAVLLGLSFAVLRLGQIRRELVEMRDRLGRAEPAFPEPPRIDPVAAVSSGGTGVALKTTPDPLPPVTNPVEAPLGPPAIGDELLPPVRPPATPPFRGGDDAASVDMAGLPAFLKPDATKGGPTEPTGGRSGIPKGGVAEPAGGRLTPPAVTVSPAPSLASPPPSPSVPGPLQGSAGPTKAEEDAPFAFTDPVVPDTPASEPLAVPTSPGPVSSDVAEPTPPAAPDGQEAAVIGTYNSGGNRYVMFSDGSIDAETPDGVFRFQSLDELKAFIASGGEKPQGS
jgi:hypothetical protein